ILTTPAPGVTIVTAEGTFPDLAAGDSRGASSHFTVRLDPGLVCGLVVPLRLTVVYEGGHASGQSFDLDLFTGKPKPAAAFGYRGAPLPIPDADEIGVPGEPVEVPIAVQGVEGRILKLSFRIDGANCTTAERAASVGIDHPFATDLTLTLQSPSGTLVKLFENADLSGNNFCQTLLEDETGRSILEVQTADAPFTGRFRPQEPLAAFKGEDPNGTWILRVTDSFPNDSGHVRAVSLLISAAECESETCGAGAEALSLQGGRFKVETCFRNQHAGGAVGFGRPERLSDQSGLFWFFSPENPEILVKVLDGNAVNARYWVYAGALSDLDYIVKFTDTETGRIRSYHNPPGGLCGLGDVVTFAPEGESLPLKEGPVSGSCVPGGSDLCLLEGRFKVQVHWRDRASGLEGTGFALPHGDRSGFFWFFDPANVELGVKIVDGRLVSGTFWLYHGALTSLDYTLTVTDTTTGTSRSYSGRQDQVCGGVDTGAFKE
ncbi:MAG TPA: proprotein convertase P-domain-containing protein, partial [Thermoanaerobaculia bacterium]|nr:proprotein convertase P-domain-containing protein [Thermoanaerobaculia bacterium]